MLRYLNPCVERVCAVCDLEPAKVAVLNRGAARCQGEVNCQHPGRAVYKCDTLGLSTRKRGRNRHGGGRALTKSLALWVTSCQPPARACEGGGGELGPLVCEFRPVVFAARGRRGQAELHHTRLSAAVCGAAQLARAARHGTDERDLQTTSSHGGQSGAARPRAQTRTWR